MSSLTDDLAATIGAEHVLTGPDLMTGYTTDWTRRYQGTAACVARPATTAQVAAIVQVCARHRVAVVSQGGNTGLVGGSVPAHGGVRALHPPPPAARSGGHPRRAGHRGRRDHGR